MTVGVLVKIKMTSILAAWKSAMKTKIPYCLSYSPLARMQCFFFLDQLLELQNKPKIARIASHGLSGRPESTHYSASPCAKQKELGIHHVFHACLLRTISATGCVPNASHKSDPSTITIPRTTKLVHRCADPPFAIAPRVTPSFVN